MQGELKIAPMLRALEKHKISAIEFRALVYLWKLTGGGKERVVISAPEMGALLQLSNTPTKRVLAILRNRRLIEASQVLRPIDSKWSYAYRLKL